jgi:hypothetical protein
MRCRAMADSAANPSLEERVAQLKNAMFGHRAFDPQTLRGDISHALTCVNDILVCSQPARQTIDWLLALNLRWQQLGARPG